MATASEVVAGKAYVILGAASKGLESGLRAGSSMLANFAKTAMGIMTPLNQGIELALKAFNVGKRAVGSFVDAAAEAENVNTILGRVVKGGMGEIKGWMPLLEDVKTITGASMEEVAQDFTKAYARGIDASRLFRTNGIKELMGFQQGVEYTAEKTRSVMAKSANGTKGDLHNAAVEAGKTWKGLVGGLADRWESFRVRIMNSGIFQWMKENLAWLNSWIDSWIEKVGPFTRRILDIVTVIEAKLIRTIRMVAAGIRYMTGNENGALESAYSANRKYGESVSGIPEPTAAVDSVFAAIKTIFSNAISAFFEWIGQWPPRLIAMFLNFLVEVQKFFVWAFFEVIALVLNLVGWHTDMGVFVANSIIAAAEFCFFGILDLFNGVVDFIIPLVKDGISSILAVANDFFGWVSPGISKFIEHLNNVNLAMPNSVDEIKAAYGGPKRIDTKDIWGILEEMKGTARKAGAELMAAADNNSYIGGWAKLFNDTADIGAEKAKGYWKNAENGMDALANGLSSLFAGLETEAIPQVPKGDDEGPASAKQMISGVSGFWATGAWRMMAQAPVDVQQRQLDVLKQIEKNTKDALDESGGALYE